jgi:hypothetical protein
MDFKNDANFERIIGNGISTGKDFQPDKFPQALPAHYLYASFFEATSFHAESIVFQAFGSG